MVMIGKILRVGCIARMLHAFNRPYDRLLITNIMPTEREYNKHNPEIKVDNSKFRLSFLDRTQGIWGYPLAWASPGSCPICFIIRVIVLGLAIVGLFSIIF